MRKDHSPPKLSQSEYLHISIPDRLGNVPMLEKLLRAHQVLPIAHQRAACRRALPGDHTLSSICSMIFLNLSIEEPVLQTVMLQPDHLKAVSGISTLVLEITKLPLIAVILLPPQLSAVQYSSDTSHCS